MSIQTFTEQEEQILRGLVPREQHPPTQGFTSIAKKFNRLLQQVGIISYKSGRSIRQQLINIYAKKRIQWSPEMQKIMLQKVSEGKKWISIANQQIFSKNKINATKIKQKFQSDMRFKFRIIYRQGLKIDNMENIQTQKQMSDRVFKMILSKKDLSKAGSVLTKEEMNILLESKPFFMQSLYQENGEKLKIRSFNAMKQMLEHLKRCPGSPSVISQVLLKLSNQLRNKNIVKTPSDKTSQNTRDKTSNIQLMEFQDWENDKNSQFNIYSAPPCPMLNSRRSLSFREYFGQQQIRNNEFDFFEESQEPNFESLPF